jgi:hypothetical protein
MGQDFTGKFGSLRGLSVFSTAPKKNPAFAPGFLFGVISETCQSRLAGM